MDTLQKNLEIVFRGVQPELLFQSIAGKRRLSVRQPEVSVSRISSDAYQGLAYAQYPFGSYEEVEGVRQLLGSTMTPDPSRIPSAPSVFYLLVELGRRVFRVFNDAPVCRFSQLLAWQSIYQKLGQDLFTTAFLACEDLRCGYPPRSEFVWDPVLKTDNVQLNALLRQGIAENHCHLGGTSQNFPLSWACLMNYPHTIRLAARQMKQNLQANYSRGTSGNVWSWERRLYWAAFLRVKLFLRLEGLGQEDSLDMDRASFYAPHSVKQALAYVRPCFGARVPQRGGSDFILDYALRRVDCKNGLLENHNRLLSGERGFLYRSFRACFDGTLNSDEQDWFYLYLLLKENFRAELIQVNRQTGFQNFKNYQDRKDGIYDGIAGYHAESVRLSVNANQSGQNIVSFEARIAPKDSAVKMYRQVLDYEAQIEYARTEAPSAARQHFFVYHFIKAPDLGELPRGQFLVQPRNYGIRASSRRSARALGYALQHYPRFSGLVRGIDAANIEIGCRPETFAVEFRYLRDLPPLRGKERFGVTPARPHIQVTYHAGEDFLDMADGLRAIDEAVRFLHLNRGDRLGHALALGVDPAVHYAYKQRRSVLCKQDLLDNLVWLFYRAQELGVSVSPKLHAMLKTQADRYLSELYGNCMNGVNLTPRLYEYYCSMRLRGDAPELYSGKELHPLLKDVSHNAYWKDEGRELETYRSSDTIQELCRRYHFDGEVRQKGRQIQEFSVSGEYIELIRGVQDRLAEELMEKGIMIECNPTSNYLIGTFRRYDMHPIFRFNNVGLTRADGSYEPSAQLSVSINTDDSGVFDTSLENEYAVIAASLDQAREDGNRKYTSNSIYLYLENVRKMGLDQIFQRLEPDENRQNSICPAERDDRVFYRGRCWRLSGCGRR